MEARNTNAGTAVLTTDDIKALRARLGFTQADLADALGVSARTVRRWEAGRQPINARASLSLQMLARTHKD